MLLEMYLKEYLYRNIFAIHSIMSTTTNMFKPSMRQTQADTPNSSVQEKEKLNETSEDIQVLEKWDDMSLPDEVLRGIFSYGYEDPSPIQKRAISPMLNNRDLIAQAQSGTGKTATFSIGSMSGIDLSQNSVQVLCLSPTRELAMQTATVYRGIGGFLDGLKVYLLVGGDSVDDNIRTLKRDTPHVVIGTPGRVFDMLRRRALMTKRIRTFILDEADEMLSHGFKDQVHDIFEQLPEDVQTCIFSATMPRHMFEVTNKFMKNPLQITVKAEQLTLEGISQYYVAVRDDVEKYNILIDLYSSFSVGHCIIYANSVPRVHDLHQAMLADGYAVCSIHSNMSKAERESSISEFRSGSCRVLISSNVTARGIDIQQVSCVINFDIPRDVSTYLHRIGRSGRWGRKGMGINLITERDVDKMREIEQYYSTQITELPADISNM